MTSSTSLGCAVGGQHHRCCPFPASGSHLHGHVQLGRLFGRSRRLERAAIDLHGHGEDGGVNGARLRDQLVLEAGFELVELHQRVHGLWRLQLLL